MIDCHKCKGYYVTWEKQFPHGCRSMNFKSTQLPSTVVYSSSGTDCMKYQRKEMNTEIRHWQRPPRESK